MKRREVVLERRVRRDTRPTRSRGIATSFFKVSAGAPIGAEAPPLIEGTWAGMEMNLAEGTGARRGTRRGGPLWSDDEGNTVNAHRLRYESTSPTAVTVWHGRSSGDDALWSDIAYSDVVRVCPLRTPL